MSFQNKNLSVLSYTNGFTLWHYTTQDVLDDVLSETYFAPVKALLNTGDIMLINCAAGATFKRIREIKGGVQFESLL